MTEINPPNYSCLKPCKWFTFSFLFFFSEENFQELLVILVVLKAPWTFKTVRRWSSVWGQLEAHCSYILCQSHGAAWQWNLDPVWTAAAKQLPPSQPEAFSGHHLQWADHSDSTHGESTVSQRALSYVATSPRTNDGPIPKEIVMWRR